MIVAQTRLVWGAPEWTLVAAGAATLLLVLLVVGYWRAGATRGLRLLAAALKAVGVVLLALCLLEPLSSGTRARPGANQFVLLADNSQSMTLHDAGGGPSRADQLKKIAPKSADWLAQLARDFDVRQYAFDTQLRSVPEFDQLTFDGRSSSLGASLDRLARRYHGRPLAGVILMTDGTATDADAVNQLLSRAASPDHKLPPIYPVPLGRETPADDVSVEDVNVTQTNFEDTPVTLAARISTSGYKGRTILAQLFDQAGAMVEQQKLRVDKDGEPLFARFRLKPRHPGVSFYKVRAAAEDQLAQFDSPDKSKEATLANNTRMAAVDRGKGPYRVLYVSGRPNWEYKFLQRAIASDDQVQLIGLVRVAKREPKFNFLSRTGESTNPLFRGFKPENKDEVEQYDQPVLVRLNTADENELRGGFPKTAEELYKYHAIVLDDLESEFFTQDQLQLVKDFVRQRGGGLLMLGGQESFKNGKFDRTPIGDMLPVYLEDAPALPSGGHFRMSLTREGWLEPWIRLRPEEDAERKRIEAMPAFQTLNPVRGIKPGATVLARAVAAEGGQPVPALVEQRFGQGRVGALLIGDLWRWSLRRPDEKQDDMEKAWRQTVRWLVAEVPQRVDVAPSQRRGPDDPDGAITLVAQVRDPSYAPLDNATVTVKITAPDNTTLELRADPDPREPGRYQAMYVPRQPGPYRAQVTAAAPDGSEVGQAQTGWTSDPAAEEFRALQPNRELLKRLAQSTGGQVVEPADVKEFVASLPTRNAQITEPYVKPLWHQSWVFLLAIACLSAEWGLRRWKGLP